MYCSLSLDNQFIHFQKFSLHFSLSLSLVHFSVIDSSPLLNTSELKISHQRCLWAQEESKCWWARLGSHPAEPWDDYNSVHHYSFVSSSWDDPTSTTNKRGKKSGWVRDREIWTCFRRERERERDESFVSLDFVLSLWGDFHFFFFTLILSKNWYI